jgi:hypothetical protein
MPGRGAVPVPDVYATISEADAATQERLATILVVTTSVKEHEQ